MNNMLFQHDLFLGFVSKVNANRVIVHVPSSVYMSKFFHHGERFHGGIVNTYIAIEGESIGFIGRITSAEIPEKERLELSTSALKQQDFHPLLEVEVLSTFDYSKVRFERSTTNFPNIGSKVYMCSSQFIDQYLQEIEMYSETLKTSGFSKLISPNIQTEIDLSLQTIFGRHTSIIGTTGSGKSWTTSSLISNLIDNGQRAILIDATGEYANLAKEYCNDETTKVILGDTHILSYKNFKIQDLFYLFKPAPGIQAPKLSEAIRSLKLLNECMEDLEEYTEVDGQGVISLNKADKNRTKYLGIYNANIDVVQSNNCQFDIRSLGAQIQNECVYPTGFNNANIFGKEEINALGHCVSLITRIENLIHDNYYNPGFRTCG